MGGLGVVNELGLRAAFAMIELYPHRFGTDPAVELARCVCWLAGEHHLSERRTRARAAELLGLDPDQAGVLFAPGQPTPGAVRDTATHVLKVFWP